MNKRKKKKRLDRLNSRLGKLHLDKNDILLLTINPELVDLDTSVAFINQIKDIGIKNNIILFPGNLKTMHLYELENWKDIVLNEIDNLIKEKENK